MTKEPQLDNEIAKLFHQLPYLDKCAVAEQIGIDVSLLKKSFTVSKPQPLIWSKKLKIHIEPWVKSCWKLFKYN